MTKMYENGYIKVNIKVKRIKITKRILELLKVHQFDIDREDARQVHLFSELPPSGGSENIITAKDVFFRNAFAYPVSSPTFGNTATVLIEIMTRLANLRILCSQTRDQFSFLMLLVR